jgi:hypothetical protein
MSAAPADLTKGKELTHESKAQQTSAFDEQLEWLRDLLTKHRTHLTAAAEKKGAYGDYLRLLEFYHRNQGRASEGNHHRLG